MTPDLTSSAPASTAGEAAPSQTSNLDTLGGA